MSTETKTVNITPTWHAAASIFIMALENGTEEGKAAAREGIYEMAAHLDNHNAKCREEDKIMNEKKAGPDVHEIYEDCLTLLEKVTSRAEIEARGKGWIIVSRGFEFLSLDANGERDENIIDYVEDSELTPEVIQEFIDDCRKQGSSFLGIGWGVDQADDKAAYDCGDYSPMFDWDDLPNIDVREQS